MPEMLHIETIETSSLGDRSYLAHDGEVAVVVDPQRDIDRVLDLAAAHGVRITHVLETHVHNDYVTGGLELAGRTGARYLLPAGSGVEFEHTAVGEGEVVEAGRMRVRVLHTPATPTITSATSSATPATTWAAVSGRCSLAGRCSMAPPAAPTWSAPSRPWS